MIVIKGEGLTSILALVYRFACVLIPVYAAMILDIPPSTQPAFLIYRPGGLFVQST